MNRGEELKPGFKKTTLIPIKGKRRVIVTSLIKTEITPENEYIVSIPPLNASQCIIPDTLALSFIKFTNSNTKSWFLKNLGRLIVDRLSVNVQGVEVYQNTGESMMEVCKDLWRSEEDRDNRQKFGIMANENVRKLISKDDSANKATKATMCDFQYRITPPKSKKIMKAQDSEEVGEYRLTDVQLECEVIESEDLAERVRGEYNIRRSLGYDYTTLLKTLPWSKDNTREVIDVNIPRKSMKAVVLLFTKKNAGDSEEFVFPNLTRVNVTVEGNPNDIYSEGLAKRDMYREAVRLFGSSTCEKYLGSKCVSRRKFYTDKFACVIDF